MTGLRFYHRVDDPWSYLLLQLLPRLLEVFDVGLECITMPFPTLDFAPRPDLLSRHALRDACDMQRHCELEFDSNGALPEPALVALASQRLLAVTDSAEYLVLARALGAALFRGDAAAVEALCATGPSLGAAAADAALAANQQRQFREGHYNTGMIGFGAAWYWGVDRLCHLEHDLLVAGLRRPNASLGLLLRRPLSPNLPARREAPLVIDFWCTFRSPYTYLAGERVFALARRYPVRIRPRLMLPMKMAGFVVPEMKSRYFRFDPAREALRHGMRFGNFCDSFGAGLERAMSLADAAEAAGCLERSILSVMQGVWADGIDTATDAGLRELAERAGLDWTTARRSLGDESWRAWAAENRLALEKLGQYAAPTFAMGDFITWGQDRIWMIEREIMQRLGHEAGQAAKLRD